MSLRSDITTNGGDMLISKCVKCNRKSSMFVNDNTKLAKRLGKFLKNIGNAVAKAGKKLVSIVLKNTGIALEIAAKISIAAASKNSWTTRSLIPVVFFLPHWDGATP